MCICIHIRYVSSSLAAVVFFIVKSESKRSPGTNFVMEDMKENIRAILVYIAVNYFNFGSNSGKTFEYSNFLIQIEYSSHP